MTICLRAYQEQALAAEAQHRIDHPDETRLAIVMATGLGKGTIIAERAVRFAEAEYERDYRDALLNRLPRNADGAMLPQMQRVLILAHTDEIVADLAARCRLRADGRFSVGIVKAELDECAADIVVASTQTLLDPRRRQRITNVGLVLVDECELYAAPQWEGILRHYGCMEPKAFVIGNADEMAAVASYLDTVKPTPALGFTATLERGDGQGLGRIWQNVCFTRDISWGVRHGYLVQPVGHRLEIAVPGPLGPLGLPTSDASLDQALIEALAPEKIVEKWIELAAGLCEECREAVAELDKPAMPSYCPNAECGVNTGPRQTVAFMPLVRSAMALGRAFMAAGVPAAVVYGDMPDAERRKVLELHTAGRIKVVVNAMVLTRGWDSPGTKCVIVGRPTKSRGLFVQMAGRGLRPVPGVPVEEQDCILICVADATTDLCSVADLSDKPIDRKMQGALTAMEDAWDIGAELADETRFWTGQVDAKQFDPLVSRSSKVWRTTVHGTPFLPISKDGEYVFVVGTSVWVREINDPRIGQYKTGRLHKDLPDLETALAFAEDEAQERGGDLGRLLADKNRPWRKQVPSAEMQGRAQQLGLGKELLAIMESRAGGKAGKVSDLISKAVATRALEPVVEKIKEATSCADS